MAPSSTLAKPAKPIETPLKSDVTSRADEQAAAGKPAAPEHIISFMDLAFRGSKTIGASTTGSTQEDAATVTPVPTQALENSQSTGKTSLQKPTSPMETASEAFGKIVLDMTMGFLMPVRAVGMAAFYGYIGRVLTQEHLSNSASWGVAGAVGAASAIAMLYALKLERGALER